MNTSPPTRPCPVCGRSLKATQRLIPKHGTHVEGRSGSHKHYTPLGCQGSGHSWAEDPLALVTRLADETERFANTLAEDPTPKAAEWRERCLATVQRLRNRAKSLA